MGGKAAARIDVRAGPAPRGCKEHPLFRTTSGSDHGLAPGERARFYVIDSGSEALTVMISGLVAREDGFEVAAGSVVQSVRFP